MQTGFPLGFDDTHCDVVVVGAGHAGVEAALATARCGLSTMLVTLSLDAVANMPCNPSIGGTGKGHLVYEIDALGGEMGYAADRVTMQSRTLNTSKGAAVRSKRIQADRRLYSRIMKETLENEPMLRMLQGEVKAVTTENGDGKMRVTGVEAAPFGHIACRAVILSTGTYLGGTTHVGDVSRRSGPDNSLPAEGLTEDLAAKGIHMLRFKTGTPPRIHRRSIDFSQLECQPGDPDNELQPFSFMTDAPMHNKVECWIAYTNPETHRIILDNIQRSPLYGGMIEGVGPRYCPSIEDKVVRFAGKDRHPIFVEPCGENTEEMYLQGASSSLPEDVQNAFYRSIKGFEHIEILRPAYAIEYDCVDPTSLEATLESKVVRGLYGAGQFNGTSGYEEAAAQGLLAGLNAARNALGKEQLILPRHTSYLGTLVDDLVTKGVMDPYRMMTSRSEYRLTLRQDNADLRLSEFAYETGLLPESKYREFCAYRSALAEVLELCRSRRHAGKSLLVHLKDLPDNTPLAEAAVRPPFPAGLLPELNDDRQGRRIWRELLVEARYDGYLQREAAEISRLRKLETLQIPADFDYDRIKGLSNESRSKLLKVRPTTLAQAGRIDGVTPADIALLQVALSRKNREATEK